MLVRTWNLFHGNASPPERRAFLREAVTLAAAGGPQIVCLQELPLWSFPYLDGWSGMSAVADVAARAMLGPVPSTPEIGRVITDLDHGLFRSAFTGQGNAVLLARELRVLEHRVLVLNPWSYRRVQGRRLALGLLEQLAWAKERRVCQVIRVQRGDGTLVTANLHGTSHPDKRLANAELWRAATFVDGFAQPDEPIILGGDFNLTVRNSPMLRQLLEREWGFEGATPSGIDHILVRALAAEPTKRWPVERRTIEGRVLSDHAPIERVVR